MEEPEQILQGSKGRKIAQKIFRKGGKDLLVRVIFSEEGDKSRIITVYVTSKISKYRGGNKK